MSEEETAKVCGLLFKGGGHAIECRNLSGVSRK